MTLPVIIVGAGAAGLSAAQQLQTHGVEYVVLEARDRVGGRVHTLEGKQAGYELGAAWFHEVPDNKLVSLAEDNEFDFVFDDQNTVAYDSESKLDQAALPAFADKFDAFRESRPADDTLEQVASAFVADQKGDDKRLAKAVAYRLALKSGVHLSQLGAHWGLPRSDRVSRDAAVQDFQKFLTTVLAKDVDPSRIRLNTEVTAITYISGSSVVVTTEQGEKIEGRSVIITLPLGVLKQHTIAFEPALNPKLQGAIQNASIARIEKVYLTFEQPFWDTDVFKFVVADDQVQALVWNWSAAHPRSPNRHTIAVLVTGELAAVIEKDRHDIFSAVKPVLRAISKTKVPEPIETLWSNWYFDKYSRGSFSSLTARHSKEELIEPFVAGEGKHGFYFAGEHATLEGTGFVHGAWLSGQRAADQAK